jgi:glycosyltransferase involved in cell wall biosynthesis
MSLRRLGVEPLRVYQQDRIPQVLTVNDDWPLAYVSTPSPHGRLLDQAVRNVHTWDGLAPRRVVYLSRAIRDHVLRAGAPFPQGRIQPQGVPLRLFPQRPFRPLHAEPTLLFVGRIHPSKAPEVAIDTVSALARRGVRARLRIAGAAVSVSYRDALQSRAETAGIRDQIEWLGQIPRDQLASLYRSSDVFLFPCAFEGEGQGLTYMEAMACGTPVVAYPRGGARELLQGGRVAVLAETPDGDGFADGVLALLHDPARTADVVAQGRLLVERTSLETYVQVLEQELHEACSLGGVFHDPLVAVTPG